MLFDVHCHLTFPEFNEDREKVIEDCGKEDISIVVSTVDLDEIELARELSTKYSNVYWTLGLSATELDPIIVDAVIHAIRENKDNIIGIGEVGLDYYWVKEKEKHEIERQIFQRFIELSQELCLPLVVHTRDAERYSIRMLRENSCTALLHCFSGTVEQAQEAVEFGCLVSIPTNVFYSKGKQRLASELPLESIVLETDAPYLAPTPKTRNTPVNIKKSVEKIAELRGISKEEVSLQTTTNARKFFRL